MGKQHVKVIVFDFDGVLVDSNELKYNAWFELFADSVSVSPKLINEALSKGTRYEMLRFIFETTGMPQNIIEKTVEDYARRYNTIIQKGILRRGLFEGVRETLEGLLKNYTFFINSATPEKALKESVCALGIERLFSGIYGKPQSKSDNLSTIMRHEKIAPDCLVFVGDGEGDRKAAQEIGCYFIGVSNVQNNWNNTDFPLIQSLPSLQGVINTMLRDLRVIHEITS